ncbi:hypothetical protein [Alitabrizicola rongguiensis]|uniref:hypothetical protein n=1 Tax=Alitabrizicola rongguiensis TaxID=2909234 RepID=UPI001F3B9B7D|nr:hypothetical protein [Tabrizicola rongguiensis]
MTTDATNLRQYRSLAEVDVDAFIRAAHIERNREIVAGAAAFFRTLTRGLAHRLQISPRILPVE